MDVRGDLRDWLDLACGRSYGLTGAQDRGPFTLPGDESHWPRDRDCDLRHLRLELDLDLEHGSISGVAVHTLVPINDGLRALEMDAVELRVKAVSRRPGSSLSFSQQNGTLRIELGAPPKAGEDMTLAIEYEATPRRGLYFNAPDEDRPDRPSQVWTQGQDEDSRYWFPCFDYPNQRFTSEIVVAVPSSWTAISNGRLVSVEENGSGKKTYHWAQERAHPTYLVSLVAGEFAEIREEHNGVPILYYSPVGREEDTRRAFAKTPKMMEFFTDKIGVPYPWDKYSQVAVADFIFGGMENTSATTMTDSLLHDERAHLDYSADSIAAHELAHQWGGDLLTCRDWSHGWLNEGFATYFDLLFKEHDLGADEFRYAVYQDATAYLEEDSRHYRRPIVSNVYHQPVDLFDRHLYEKGGLVLHMLRYVPEGRAVLEGTSPLLRKAPGQQRYHRGPAAGRGRRRRGRTWTGSSTSGSTVPGIPSSRSSTAGTMKPAPPRSAISQAQTGDDVVAVFRMPVRVAFETSEGLETSVVNVSQREQSFFFPLRDKPKMVQFDPGYRCLKTLDFSRPKEMLLHQLKEDEDVVGRVQAAQDLAKLGAPDCVEALKVSVLNDAIWGVQAEAAKGLGSVRSASAMQALVQCTTVAHPKARRAVARALGEFKEPAAFDALQPLLDGDESYFCGSGGRQSHRPYQTARLLQGGLGSHR